LGSYRVLEKKAIAIRSGDVGRDDLTDLSYDNRGWFLNLTGYY